MVKYVISASLAVCLVAVINAGEIPPEFKEIAPEVRRVCLEETGAKVEWIEKANKGEFTDDPKFKCYLKCTVAQFGAVSRKGVNFDALAKLAPPAYKEKLEKIIAVCKDTKGTIPGDVCDQVYESSKCFQRTSPDDYFVM
ncbi:general odorant-binding protein 83a [Diachasma alloeum]|uniref:Odorant binding protein 5 n=1 Tax=Diachasma alloeum TaxID=454923 RepID=A0A4E0S3Q3_9HYME|nr:general odorant-binding protein 83a [Diachasma alloeum]THK32955.1 odorant binding protein 5 [Diachasma alloeum]